MSKTDRTLHEIARRVVKSRHGAASASSAAVAEAMQRSCGELYRALETAMGAQGLQALIDRAIQVTAREYRWLAAVRWGAADDCPLSGLAEAAAQLDVDDAVAGFAALLATIIGLLITFIGEDLTLRFLRLAWPDVTFSKLSEGSND